MLDLSVIILTYNEEIHIRRCLENVRLLARDIFVVDSFSTDKTCDIARGLGARVYQNKWENNHAKQFNWALERLPIATRWVLRLDADEYLTGDLLREIEEKLPGIADGVTGVVFKRRHIFLGKWIRRGTYPVKLLRLFRYRKAVCEERFMDEHIQLLEGESLEAEHDFVDHNLNSLSWWSNKHVGYAVREAADLLNIKYALFNSPTLEGGKKLGTQAESKRRKKIAYSKQPLFLRAFVYFIYRYIFKGGFLEGREGFLWHFLQGWWYRTLVDAKVFEIEKLCGNDKTKIAEHLRREYGIG